MKNYAYNEITLMQYIFLINGAQVGTGVLSLPRVLADKAGTDGWIAILIGWIFSMMANILIVKMVERYPSATLYEILIRLFGKIIGKAVVLVYMMYFAFFACSTLVNACLYIKSWFLPKTPDYIILLLFSIPTFLVARNGIRILGRYSELSFYLVMWIPLFFLIPLRDGNWLHFLPLLKEGWKPVLSAVPTTTFSFLGFEVAFFLYPFLKKKQYAVLGVAIANTITMLFYLFTTMVCFAYFSPEGILEYNQPVLNLVKLIEFRFLERFDMILLAHYLIVVSTAWIPWVYFSVFCSSKLLGKQDHSSHVVVLLLIFIGIIFWHQPTWNESEKWQIMIVKGGLLLAYVAPPFLWVYSWIFEKYRRRVNT
ncbi:GerAB/ArcD/ProY family transporter [Bacillus salipaludis]|uniref:Endospore germination permease n=1 Tax=Bacillus salipaludis TaxID=2547811 RepID=A0AA90QV01_9BACI|nr:GerAB/ArcD/ProY family transporter [Bacillus salipaludis]MDQ6598892.1 endospore germination permease [Bacillus salipaludis]